MHIRIFFLLPLFLISCSSTEPNDDPDPRGGTFAGSDRRIGNGEARAFVTLDDEGVPTEIGVRLDQDALAGIPYNLGGATSRVYELSLPPEADSTPFRHVTIDWYPQGDGEDGRFDTARFDVHFYTVAKGELEEIDPAVSGAQAKAENLLSAAETPAGYETGDPVTFEPKVGVHWYDPATLPGTSGFAKNLFYGSWDGALTFIEVRMAWDWLAGTPQYSSPLPQPTTWPTSGPWPTTWTIATDEANQQFVITFGNFE